MQEKLIRRKLTSKNAKDLYSLVNFKVKINRTKQMKKIKIKM